jgi:uncharacterized protein (TIGR03067 family)
MPRCLILCLCVPLLLLQVAVLARADDDPEPVPNVAAEMRRNAGTYEVIRFERNGAAYPAETLATMKVVLGADGKGTFQQGDHVTESSFVLFPNKKRGEYDTTITGSDQAAKGIYKVQGDTMTCCMTEPGGKDRPTKYESPAGSRLTLYVLKRVKK